MRKRPLDEFEKARYSLFCGDPVMYRLLFFLCLDWKTVEVFFKQLLGGEYSSGRHPSVRVTGP